MKEKIHHQWQSFLIALQFLTTIPISLTTPVSNRNMGQSLLYYPLVGFIIGLLLLVSIHLLENQTLLVSSVLTLTLWVGLSGGLHLDGLADSADAWLGGLGNKDRTLQLMKDPTSGPIAIVVLLLVLLIKFVMLAELIRQQQWLAIVMVLVLTRSALPLLLLTTPYVRKQGLGSVLVDNMPKDTLRKVLALISVIAIISLGPLTVISFLVVFLLLRYCMLKRLNGTTGDTAGALVELLETTTLITLVIL